MSFWRIAIIGWVAQGVDRLLYNTWDMVPSMSSALLSFGLATFAAIMILREGHSK